MLRVPFISFVTFLAIAACSARNPVDPRAASSAALPDINVPAPSVSGEPHGATHAAAAEPSATSSIPAALEGRWALAPHDCTATAREAKGLLVIKPGELNFQQSRAVPADHVESDGRSIAGDFTFVADGRSWTRYEALKVEKGTLTRTETHPTASFSYAKCS